MDPARREKYERQTEELYAAIGRFAVKFEHVVHAMSTNIMWLLFKAGLQDQRMGFAVTAGLTAEPLRRMLAAIMADTLGDQASEADRRIVANILKRVSKLTESRNDVIHRMWYVGWASEEQEDFSTAAGLKFKATNAGTVSKSLEYSVAEFNALSETADEVRDLVNRMCGCLLLFQPRRIEDNFVVDTEGNAHIPPSTPPA